jgi:hypothetical protein
MEWYTLKDRAFTMIPAHLHIDAPISSAFDHGECGAADMNR